MKKFLSVMLAVAMVVSLASVAMAKTDPDTGLRLDGGFSSAPGEGLESVSYEDNPTIKVDDGKPYYPVVNLLGPFSFDADDKALYNDVTTHGPDNKGYTEEDGKGYEIKAGPVEYGDTAYYALIQFIPDDVDKDNDADDGATIEYGDDGIYTLVQDSETVSGLKIKADWEENGDMVKKISVVKKRIDNSEDENVYDLEDSSTDYDDDDVYYPTAEDLGLDKFGYKSGKYYYFLCISYEDTTSVEDTDVIGTLTISKSKDPSVDKMELDVAVNLDWENSWRKTDATTGESEYKVEGDNLKELKTDTNYAFKFDYDDEVEFPFEDDSTFTVDVSGQGKILFNYNTDPISKIVNKYYMAELNFWNGNGAKFNRVGEFFLSCEDLEGNQFLYQVNSNGTLSEVPGAEWDDSDEGFYFNTRTLGSYVISDMELDLAPVVSAPSVSTPVVSAPVISNPSTGAAE